MRLEGSRLLLSATDLANHLGCPHLTDPAVPEPPGSLSVYRRCPSGGPVGKLERLFLTAE
jgi:hypothetical protein